MKAFKNLVNSLIIWSMAVAFIADKLIEVFNHCVEVNLFKLF